MQYKILIVDDEPMLTGLLADYLGEMGYLPLTAADSVQAMEKLKESPDLILLDINMPGMNGLELCRTIRDEVTCPILFLTARDAEQDKINGLLIGGDDYITKPFNPLEVTARVKTQLRRYRFYNQTGQTPEINEYDIRGLVINREHHKCYLFGKELSLTPIEFSILWYLCENQGKVVASEELFEAVWGEKYLNNNNTVMAHIGRIREKMHETAKNPKFIKTVWGVGYKIEK